MKKYSEKLFAILGALSVAGVAIVWVLILNAIGVALGIDLEGLTGVASVFIQLVLMIVPLAYFLLLVTVIAKKVDRWTE